MFSKLIFALLAVTAFAHDRETMMKYLNMAKRQYTLAQKHRVMTATANTSNTTNSTLTAADVYITDEAGCDKAGGNWVTEEAGGVSVSACVTHSGKAVKLDGTIIDDASQCPGGCAVAGVCAAGDDASKKACEDYAPSSGVGLIIAIIVGLLVAVGVGILVWCCCCKKDD